jgi:hypothetical protein
MLCREDRRWLAPVALAVAAVAGAWLGGDWLGSGDALRGGVLAREAAAAPGRIDAFELTAAALVAPLLVVLWIGGVAASWRSGDRFVLAMAAAGVTWAAADAALASAGFPVPPRFLLPAAAAAAAIAGLGASALRKGWVR